VTGVLPPVTEYPVPLTAICEIPTLELPVFVTATFCEVDDVPVVTLPKVKLVGLTPRVYVAAIPEPLRETEVGVADALLTIETLPEAAPIDAGRKFAVIVAFWPGLTLIGSDSPPTVNAVEPDAVT